MRPTLSISDFVARHSGLESGARVRDEEVVIVGRIRAKRDASKKLCFMDVEQDGARVQVLSEEQEYEVEPAAGSESAPRPFRALHRMLRRGDYIAIRGFPGKSGKGELSVVPREIRVLAPCAHNLPESLTDPELRHRHRHLDLLVNPAAREVALTRSRVIRWLRDHLWGEGFVEVETPTLSALAGGALARPFETDCRALDATLQLRIAPELYLKQLVVGGIERVFELGKVFRNESLSPQHNPEFTTCELYRAHADYADLMPLTETVLAGMAATALGGADCVARVPGEHLPPAAREHAERTGALSESGELCIDFAGPYPRLSIPQALEEAVGEPLPLGTDAESVSRLRDICARHGVAMEPPHTAGRLVDALVGHFLEPRCLQPTFLCDHPLALSPLAREHSSMPGCAERFELFAAGRELCNAYTELSDPDEQRRRFAAQDSDREAGDEEVPAADEAFCQALEYGMPPTAGWGLGVDRMIMLLTRSTHIRDVILFPAMRPRQAPGGGGQ